ncbi:unnamed protein product (macronuclear) [Paramecium tetraurelia]|uniref:Uncharacterized protein n=1 Tax=Paramecium tetraurelia TaxID=5888 RepID=A0E9W1_PARTE|nr:uncharacterized protein GSPATT00024809001 [Paramecium tetraurelia]CAK92078.1 unnamed protein product [Paramecium tetraurelia]|eukprot:XP_001459475.1 hypothetical protein (macronuclear) [Paramecium tetraurelia strain d4-2]
MKLLVLLCIVTLTFADSRIDFFNKLSQSDFGKTILQTIQVQENNVERVLQFIRQLQVDINAAQTEHTNYLQNRNGQITQYINEADQALAKAKQQKAQDEAQLPLKEEELNDKRAQGETKFAEKQRNLDRIAALTAEREERTEIVGLLAALNQGKKLIQQIKTGSVFTQQEIFADIEHHHKKFIQRFPDRRGFNSLVSLSLAMAQDSTLKSDQSALEKVVQVIEDLADSLFQLQKQEMEADDAREAAFQQAIARLEIANQSLEGAVAYLHAQILRLEQSLLELQNDIATQAQMVVNKQNEKTDWLNIQRDETKSYGKQTENRKSQLDLLGETENVFSKGPLTPEQQSFLQHLK